MRGVGSPLFFMDEEIKIIDNFLPDNIFTSVNNMFHREDFPWFWAEAKTYEESSFMNPNPIDNYQFVHMFYNYNERISTWNIQPIVERLDIRAIVKIKCNLSPRTSEIVSFGFHSDFDFDCKTSIYYINTNNGYTEFINGKKVESIGNRMVIFDSKIKHRGTTCTDQKRRMVLNLNYF
jgi:hypothetical protein